MKLQLAREQNIDVLTATGAISVQDVKILRAGITKLMRAGKNRIVLEIVDAGTIPPEAIRDLSSLDMLARELSGRIVVASGVSSLKVHLDNFAQPPVIPCVASRKEAIQLIIDPPEAKAAKKPEKKAEPAPAPAPKISEDDRVAVEKIPPEPSLTREEFQKREVDQYGALRKQNAQLMGENKVLRDQLAALILQRRQPPDEPSYKLKIQMLENKLEEAMNQLGASAKK